MKKSRIKQRKRVNPKYKDRVFKFIFGNPANKECVGAPEQFQPEHAHAVPLIRKQIV